ISMVTVLVSGKQAFPYLAAVRLDGPAGFFGELRVALDKLRLEVFDQPQKIVPDQHLAVAMGPRADADGRHADGFGDHTREIRRYALQHNRKDAGFLQRPGVFDQRPPLGFFAPLYLKPAEIGRASW